MTEWISTKRAMQILGVGSTTIKRWADEGVIASSRTAGGHRRFRVDDVNRFSRQQLAIVNNSVIDRWIKLLAAESNGLKMRREITQLQRRLGDWYRTADTLENVMRGVLRRFSEDDESESFCLIATGRLGLAVSAISESIATAPAGPTGLVASFGERNFPYSLSLIQLCAKSDGINLLWAPEKISVNELASQIRHLNQRLIVLCVADECADRDRLFREYREISAACQEEDVELVIGFGDFSPDIGDYGHRFNSFDDLKDILTKLRPVLEAAPETRN